MEIKAKFVCDEFTSFSYFSLIICSCLTDISSYLVKILFSQADITFAAHIHQDLYHSFQEPVFMFLTVITVLVWIHLTCYFGVFSKSGGGGGGRVLKQIRLIL